MESSLFSPSQFLTLFSLLCPPVPSGALVLPCIGHRYLPQFNPITRVKSSFCPPELQFCTSILALGGVGEVLDRGGLWNFKKTNKFFVMKLGSMKIQYPTILCGAWPGIIWYYGKHIYKWKSCQQFFTPLKTWKEICPKKPASYPSNYTVSNIQYVSTSGNN